MAAPRRRTKHRHSTLTRTIGGRSDLSSDPPAAQALLTVTALRAPGPACLPTERNPGLRSLYSPVRIGF